MAVVVEPMSRLRIADRLGVESRNIFCDSAFGDKPSSTDPHRP
ncbi:hypothetical protein MA6G0212_4519 [Mycobacteroides abscessus 6G-0212]|nr:hypothetical protein MA6G0212_4519 [Mycobacteroides abscessus 6G-0212]